MRKLIFTLAAVALSTFGLNAQLTEGHVKYDIEMSSDNPEMQMQLAMMQGSKFELYFKDNLTRSEMSMGSLMKISTITNTEAENSLMLMSGMMGNIAVVITPEDVQSAEVEAPEMEVVFVDETKEIQGYTCRKAVVTDEDGSESIFWYTEEINLNKKGQSYLNSEVPGFPLEFEINKGDLKMTMLSTEFSKKLDKKMAKELFDTTIPEGYKEMNMDELGNMGM